MCIKQWSTGKGKCTTVKSSISYGGKTANFLSSKGLLCQDKIFVACRKWQVDQNRQERESPVQKGIPSSSYLILQVAHLNELTGDNRANQKAENRKE